MAGFSEAVGGIFLLLGLQTRLFGLLIALTMLGAMFLQQINEGLWNMLPAMGFLWVGLYAVVLGSGRFGVDYLLIERMMRKSV
jgi:putative oxidoreductase